MPIPIGMICRVWITKNGERIYAKDHGKRAFCFYPKGSKVGDVKLPEEKTVPGKQGK